MTFDSETWPTLPTIAHEIDVAESTARRWAAAFDQLLRSDGRGAGRRFDPRARSVLARAKTLYGRGLTTREVGRELDREFAPSASTRSRFEDAPQPAPSPPVIPTAPPPVPAPTPPAVALPDPTLPNGAAELAGMLEGLTEQVRALLHATDAAAASQARENERLRAVLEALVDLIEVQEHHHRLADAERERTTTQDFQRVMLAVQELLAFQRRRCR